MKIEKSTLIIGFVIIVGFICHFFFKKDYRIALKKDDTDIVIAHVTRLYKTPRAAGSYIDFDYYREGKELRGHRGISHQFTIPRLLVNKYFPVVVSKKDPDDYAILITPKDFAFFDKEFPDSLKWVVGIVTDDQK